MKNIRDTLEQFAEGWKTLGQKHPSFEEFVLEYGKTFHGVQIGQRGERKGCFMNAARQVTNSDGALVYVEGYCSHKKFGLPILHAWVEDRYDGIAYEVTMDDPENFEYFGIRYQTEYLLKQICRHKVWGILGGHPRTARDLIDGLDPKEWRL